MLNYCVYSFILKRSCLSKFCFYCATLGQHVQVDVAACARKTTLVFLQPDHLSF